MLLDSLNRSVPHEISHTDWEVPCRLMNIFDRRNVIFATMDQAKLEEVSLLSIFNLSFKLETHV